MFVSRVSIALLAAIAFCLANGQTETLPVTTPGGNLCDGLLPGFHAMPDNCTSFLFCMRDVAIIGACPNATVWSSASNQCAAPELVAAPCGSLNMSSVEWTCENKTAQLYEHPDRCDMFMSCKLDAPLNKTAWNATAAGDNSTTTTTLIPTTINSTSAANTTTPQLCKATEAFDELAQKCQPAVLIEGCHPTAASDTNATSICEKALDGFYPDTVNCGQSIACVSGVPFRFACPPSLPVWDNATWTCTSATNATNCTIAVNSTIAMNSTWTVWNISAVRVDTRLPRGAHGRHRGHFRHYDNHRHYDDYRRYDYRRDFNRFRPVSPCPAWCDPFRGGCRANVNQCPTGCCAFRASALPDCPTFCLLSHTCDTDLSCPLKCCRGYRNI